MQLFIDTANINEIKIAADWGIIDGVTTNPTLISREGRDFKQTVLEICHIVDGPISAEVISPDCHGMVEEAKEISQWHSNVIIKIPCTPEGIKAAKSLKQINIKTNVTLVFSCNQVLLAAKAGATFISPFVGRLDDAGEDWEKFIKESVEIIEKYKFSAQLIIASIRNPFMVQRSALAGAHIATVPFNVLQEMFNHPLTDAGIKRFLEDWGKR